MTIRRPGRPTPSLGHQGLRSLRHHNFRLFFAGQLVSVAGTWMQAAALAWLVLELTGDPLMIGVVLAAQYAPVLFLGLFGGLIADGLPKRPTLMATQAVSMGLALTLFALAATGQIEVWQIVLLAAGLGTTNAVDMPVRQSFAIEIVGREDIANAVALNSALFNAARIVGPAIAGVLIGAFDISAVFLINGLSYLAVLAALAAMRPAELLTPPPIPRPRSVREVGAVLGEGLAYIRRSELILLAIVTLAATATFGMNFQVLIPPLARDVLGSSSVGFGFLMAASGIGSLVAAIGIAIWGTRPMVIAIGALLLGAAELVLAASRLYPISFLAMVAAGAGAIALAATVNTTIQLRVPDQLRGRVLSIYTTVFVGSSPIGGLIMGAIASSAGVATAVAVGGVVSLVVGVAAAVGLRRLERPTAPSMAEAPAPASMVEAREAPSMAGSSSAAGEERDERLAGGLRQLDPVDRRAGARAEQPEG